MGEPIVRRTGEGFFTRLGRAIDTFNGNDGKSSRTAAGKPTDVASAKPLPKKYAASSGRVVRGPMGNYVTQALKLADDMRALAVEEDGIFNRTTPKDVDKVTNKYRPLIIAATSARQKRQLAETMIKELYDTPTGNNLFWDLRKNHGNYYNCRERFFIDEDTYIDNSYLRKEYGVEWENSQNPSFDNGIDCSDGGNVTTCTVLGAVTMSKGIHPCTRENIHSRSFFRSKLNE